MPYGTRVSVPWYIARMLHFHLSAMTVFSCGINPSDTAIKIKIDAWPTKKKCYDAISIFTISILNSAMRTPIFNYLLPCIFTVETQSAWLDRQELLNILCYHENQFNKAIIMLLVLEWHCKIQQTAWQCQKNTTSISSFTHMSVATRNIDMVWNITVRVTIADWILIWRVQVGNTHQWHAGNFDKGKVYEISILLHHSFVSAHAIWS